MILRSRQAALAVIFSLFFQNFSWTAPFGPTRGWPPNPSSFSGLPWDLMYHCFNFRTGYPPGQLDGFNLYFSGGDALGIRPGWNGISGGNGYNLLIDLYFEDGRMYLDVIARKEPDAIAGLCRVEHSEILTGGRYGFSVPPPEPVKIWADAGRGGDGGDAFPWSSEKYPCAVESAGHGGDAGRAGDIVVHYSDPKLLDYVEFHAEGDMGGMGGQGYHPPSGSCHPDRARGEFGRPGLPGTIHLIYEPVKGVTADYDIFRYRYKPGYLAPKTIP